MMSHTQPSTDRESDNRPGTSASLTISFDLELAWGSIENGQWRAAEAAGVFTRTREAMALLLGQMDATDIAATWAMVGAMCEPAREAIIDHLPAELCLTWHQFQQQARPDSQDGRDLVDDITGRRAAHVFCSHSYSHLRYRHPIASAEFAAADLQLTRDRRPQELPWTEAFVFPRNDERFHEVLRDQGIRLVRGSDQPPYTGRGWRRQWDRLCRYTTIPPASRRTTILPGLDRVSDSMGYLTGGPAVLAPVVQWRAFRGLDAAVRRRHNLHIWTHPFNFAQDARLLAGFLRVLRRAARLRDQGILEILPCQAGATAGSAS